MTAHAGAATLTTRVDVAIRGMRLRGEDARVRRLRGLGRATTAVKSPDQLAEVAEAAVRLDGVSQLVLTTGTSTGRDRGAGGDVLATTGTSPGVAAADVEIAGALAGARQSMFHLRGRRPELYTAEAPLTALAAS